MKISEKSKEGFEWAVAQVEQSLSEGKSATKALEKIGITKMEDTYFFMEYLRETNNQSLLDRLK
jgi:hypothetical protein